MNFPMMKLGAAATLALGLSYQAAAAPIFTFNPSTLGGQQSFDSDRLSASSSTLITVLSTTEATGTGYMQIAGFNNPTGAGDLGPLVTGLGLAYSMWIEFSYGLELTSGSMGTADSTYDLTTMSLSAYAVKNAGDSGTFDDDVTFTAANASTGTGGTVVSAAEILLGSGILTDVGLANEVVWTEGLGAALNVTADFGLTQAGEAVFVSPFPFYDLAFGAITNEAQGITSGTVGEVNYLAIQGSGTVTFNDVDVPEPATLALLGLGLVGFGAARRRQA